MTARGSDAGRSAGSILGKMMPGAVLAGLAGPVAADEIGCVLEDGSRIAFAIDRNQFALPQDPKDPPRRAVTWVEHGPVQYAAEPFVIGSMRGFHAQGPEGSSIMFSISAAGAATYTNTRMGTRLTGQCEDN